MREEKILLKTPTPKTVMLPILIPRTQLIQTQATIRPKIPS